MKHFFTTLLTLISLVSIGTAQNGVPPYAGARGIAMGDATVAFHDINAAFSNQAGLAFLESVSATIGAERRYLTGDIGSYSLAVAYPMQKAGTVGLSVNYYGISEYNETRVGLSYARKLSKKLSIGAQFDYIGFSAEESGSKSMMTFELGLYSQLIENLFVGAHVYNPIEQEITEGEKLPMVFSLGAAYQPNKKLTLSGEFEKDSENDMQFKAGVEYFVIDMLAIRAGIGTVPTSTSFGLGLNLKSGLSLDVSSSYDYTLGFTPAISITYGGSAKKTVKK